MPISATRSRRLLAALGLGLAALLAAGGVAAGEPDAEAEPEKPRNTLRWTTASEVDNFGFDVYRAESKDGPWTRMTKQPIPGAGTNDVPQRYVWVDETIDPRREYWYWVESISMTGDREPFTPVIRAPAKIRDDAPAEEPAPESEAPSTTRP